MNDRPLSHRATLPISTLAAVCFLLASLAYPARAQAPQTSPAELVREAIRNELNDDARTHLFAWKARKDHGHKTVVEHDVQTPSGVVGRVILIDDKPLNPRQQREEDARVRTLLDPEQMRTKLKDQREDDARTSKMLSAIPDAFDFAYLDSATAPNGHKLTTFQFTPRPGYNPPSREVAVFTGMRGNVVLDETALRLTKVDGTLFKDVNFGWGILGRLYKGGRFLVEKGEIAPTHWDTTHMIVHFDGKEIIFKSIHINEEETDWDYKPVPPMSVEQALDFLNHSEAPQDASSSASPGSSPAAPSAAQSTHAGSHTRALALDSPQSSPQRKP
jgi:hypothetical protein